MKKKKKSKLRNKKGSLVVVVAAAVWKKVKDQPLVSSLFGGCGVKHKLEERNNCRGEDVFNTFITHLKPLKASKSNTARQQPWQRTQESATI